MTALAFEVVLAATGDRAEAETADAALLAARTMVGDARAAGGETKVLRESLYVTENGTYGGVLTALAREGFVPTEGGYSVAWRRLQQAAGRAA